MKNENVNITSVFTMGGAMAGKIHQIITEIIEQRSKGNPTIRETTKTKLIIKGIVPEKFSLSSEDDPEIIAKLQAIAKEMGLSI